MPQQPRISISIVSHGQGALVKNLLSDLSTHCATPLEVILTINIGENLPFSAADFGFPIRVVKNAAIKGFGANHNAAFRHVKAPFFCVLNPDIRLENDPFPVLLGALDDVGIGVAAPKRLSPGGKIEDSARRFPAPLFILKKTLGMARKLDYEIGDVPVRPEWVAGMFMLFRSEIFQKLCGFDERYFLYYEDVDLCLRLRRLGYDVLLMPQASAVHDARRQSHRSIRYLLWHASSLLRFLYRRQRYKQARGLTPG